MPWQSRGGNAAKSETTSVRSLLSSSRLSEVPCLEASGHVGVSVFAHELGEFVEELGFGDTTAVGLGVEGAPEFLHLVPAVHFNSPGPGLRDGHQDDVPGAALAVEVWEFTPAAVVGWFIQDTDVGCGEPAVG